MHNGNIHIPPIRSEFESLTSGWKLVAVVIVTTHHNITVSNNDGNEKPNQFSGLQN